MMVQRLMPFCLWPPPSPSSPPFSLCAVECRLLCRRAITERKTRSPACCTFPQTHSAHLWRPQEDWVSASHTRLVRPPHHRSTARRITAHTMMMNGMYVCSRVPVLHGTRSAIQEMQENTHTQRKKQTAAAREKEGPRAEKAGCMSNLTKRPFSTRRHAMAACDHEAWPSYSRMDRTRATW